MKNTKDYLEDISEIRSIMERSSNFISLSGLSGILAGIYALGGAYVAYRIIYLEDSGLSVRDAYVLENDALIRLSLVAAVVLVLAIGTGFWLTTRKNDIKTISLKDEGFRKLMINLSIPLIAGGLFILILVWRGYFGIVAPAFLIFYGLALINGSNYTISDIRYLGLIEIALGLVCAVFPGYGLFFWAFGFGVMHIVYGTVMYYKYEK